jgi:hypothetical protein
MGVGRERLKEQRSRGVGEQYGGMGVKGNRKLRESRN